MFLDPIMFGDDINIFYSHQNVKAVFGTVNCELQKICEWFRVNKLYSKMTETNYTLFIKNSLKDELPLKMPESKIGSSIMKRKSLVKFLGVTFDENISWKDRIKRLKNNQPKLVYYIVQIHILMKCPKNPYIFHIFIHI